ncbi:DUF5067 domain-containing protein [Enterococcus rivorum]|uniref:DUF5067 domain-containing protein n=2 Tax=Enterococcus rivorum TaxID=762845 RepID=A0A1E5KSG2_9ENTE|nr:DUF5067 domain-containing protein [Enterococcus rivorum]
MKLKLTILLLGVAIFLLSGCTQKLDKAKQSFDHQGISYEMQLPGGWKRDKEVRSDYGLQTVLSAEDTKSNSYLFITSIPVKEVQYKGFGEETREKIKERYNYKKTEDVYMKEIKIGDAPAYKYTVNTSYKDKSVWAHLYYIWTEHGFVQMTFYSADDNSYEKRSEIIDEAVATFKEVDFDETKAQKGLIDQEKEEGDVITIENKKLKMETTGVRQITGTDNKKLLAIRYTFTNLALEAVQPAVWKEYVVAKQNEKPLRFGELPEDTSFLDVKELVMAQSKELKQGEQVESVVLYELLDKSRIELSFSQEEFPEKEPVGVVIPE